MLLAEVRNRANPRLNLCLQGKWIAEYLLESRLGERMPQEIEKCELEGQLAAEVFSLSTSEFKILRQLNIKTFGDVLSLGFIKIARAILDAAERVDERRWGALIRPNFPGLEAEAVASWPVAALTRISDDTIEALERAGITTLTAAAGFPPYLRER